MTAVVRRLGRWRFLLIVGMNLIPVAGVAMLGWDAGYILMLYWAENLVLGAISLVRILTARGERDGARPPFGNHLGAGCFFIVHYGGFCLGHGVFAASIASKLAPNAGSLWARTFGDRSFQLAALATVILQVVWLIRDWWGAGRWRESSAGFEMFRPYGRILVLHVTVILGAWALEATQAPAGAILVLCLMKMILELGVAALSGDRRR